MLLGGLAVGCGAGPQTVLKLQGEPGDALVTINERYIGTLGQLGRRGVRIPHGKHRVTVTMPGYFPWDELVEVGEEPVAVPVQLTAIPD